MCDVSPKGGWKRVSMEKIGSSSSSAPGQGEAGGETPSNGEFLLTVTCRFEDQGNRNIYLDRLN